MTTTGLKGKTAIVTGSTSGIGQGIAEAFAAEGVNVVFNGFGDKAAIDTLVADTAKKFNIKTSYSNADMSKPAEVLPQLLTKEMVVEALKRNAPNQ